MPDHIPSADEATLTGRAKPAGVRGAQIWVKIGDPAPADPSELTFLATDTRTPYLPNSDGGPLHAALGKHAR